MNSSFNHHYIYCGNVIHKRFSPKKHRFNYRLYMLALDVFEIEKSPKNQGLFGFSWYHPLRFVEKDYLRGEPNLLSDRITNKVRLLNGHQDIKRIVMLVQVRCFGIYFSPANFYFCYDKNDNCTQMLAEVSNTPWNERHYYLVDLLKGSEALKTKKAFQVSPFLDLDMSYFWSINPPKVEDDKLLIKIENRRDNLTSNVDEKIFEATLMLRKQAFNKRNLLRTWCQLPSMTIKVISAIYWQAFKLILKRVPFLGYKKTGS